MQHTQALQLWYEIKAIREKFTNADCVEEAQKYYKRLKKLQHMYDKCVSEEAHREVINTIELTTKGF